MEDIQNNKSQSFATGGIIKSGEDFGTASEITSGSIDSLDLGRMTIGFLPSNTISKMDFTNCSITPAKPPKGTHV